VAMPAQRSTMHLDTVMTLVDRDALTVYPDARDALVGYRLRPAPGRVSAERVDDRFAAIARTLDLPALRLLETGGDRYETEREQWDDGNSVLAVAPGVVIAYERNVTRTRARATTASTSSRSPVPSRPRPRRSALHVLSDRARRAPTTSEP
jgi:arginine deiminase